MEACYRGHLNVVKRLKESGAAWDVVDAAGHTALTWAVDGGHAEVVSYILKDGFPVRSTHHLLLHACMHFLCMCATQEASSNDTKMVISDWFIR